MSIIRQQYKDPILKCMWKQDTWNQDFEKTLSISAVRMEVDLKSLQTGHQGLQNE